MESSSLALLAMTAESMRAAATTAVLDFASAMDCEPAQRVCSSVVRAADLCEGRFPASPSSHGSGFHDPSAAGWYAVHVEAAGFSSAFGGVGMFRQRRRRQQGQRGHRTSEDRCCDPHLKLSSL